MTTSLGAVSSHQIFSCLTFKQEKEREKLLDILQMLDSCRIIHLSRSE